MGRRRKTISGWYHIDIPLYNRELYLFVGDFCRDDFKSQVLDELKKYVSTEKLKDMLEDGFDKEDEGDAIYFDDGPIVGTSFVRLKEFDESIDSITTLAHECLHSAMMIADAIGIKEESPYEAVTYLMEYIFRECLIILTKQNSAKE